MICSVLVNSAERSIIGESDRDENMNTTRSDAEHYFYCRNIACICICVYYVNSVIICLLQSAGWCSLHFSVSFSVSI